jgi:hypothetical protein
VRAVDAAGNVGPSAVSARFVVDTVAPRVRRLRARPKGETVRLTFKAAEAGARFRCRLDGRGLARCRSPRVVRVGPGRHRFEVRAVDRAGNRGPVAGVAFRVVV